MNTEENKRENIIVKRSFQFALEIVVYAERLENEKKYVIQRQLLRAGTSIGANIREAQSAESIRDFVHKMKIAAKEAEETEYWLMICQHSSNYPDCVELINEIREIIKILTSIIHSTNKKIKGQ